MSLRRRPPAVRADVGQQAESQPDPVEAEHAGGEHGRYVKVVQGRKMKPSRARGRS
jgi:hypothetical protein